MYLFYFNTEHGTSNEVYVGEITNFRSNKKSWRSTKDGYVTTCDIDRTSALTQKTKRSRFTIAAEEGRVYRRRFWLETEDYNRATEILNDYLKTRWLEARDKFYKLESQV